jgi:ribosomal protein S18 acetylase RimI-like enzyme
MRGPATISDAIVRGGASTFEQRDGYAVVETPARRDFWFGNMLVLDAAPSPDEYAAWLSLCARTFAERGVRRYVVQWETAGSADDLTAVALPNVELHRNVVLCYPGSSLSVPDSFAIRALESDGDLAAACALDVADAEPAHADFVRWRFGLVAGDCRAGRAHVFGAWEGERLTAFAGVYLTPDYARFSTPVTGRAFRRRGIFSALCARIVALAAERTPAARIVIVAEEGSDAERLYRKLGFEPAGRQYALVETILGPGAS